VTTIRALLFGGESQTRGGGGGHDGTTQHVYLIGTKGDTRKVAWGPEREEAYVEGALHHSC